MTDPLNDALKEATLAVLLGSTSIPHNTIDASGNIISYGTVTMNSAFADRIKERARKGEFDSLIDEAVSKITADHLAQLLGAKLAEHMLEGLEPTRGGWNQPDSPGWLSKKAKEIAIEAATTALSTDESLLETLRARIGMEVDRNRVGISVQLSDPEGTK